VIAVLLGLAGAHTADADVTLTAKTGTGFIYGLAREIVYSTYSGNLPYTESELDWDIKPLFSVQAVLELRTSVGFSASLEVRIGVPGQTGSTGDSDWLDYEINGTSVKTNYSQSDCYTERAILLDTQAGWEFPLADWVTIEPFLAFNFMDFKWSARDGYLQYPPGWFTGSPPQPYPASSGQPQVPISGTNIIYEQIYFIPAVGLSAKLSFGKSLGGSIAFQVSPFVFCNDVDNHLEQVQSVSKNYFDSMSGGLLLEPKISLVWQVLAKARLSLDVSYRHIAGLIGNTSIVNTGVGSTPGLVVKSSSNSAGASYDALSVSLGFAWEP
jgi:outer membrane protease